MGNFHGAAAYLVADQVRSKLIGTHWHLKRLIVLGRNIYVAHEEAAAHEWKSTYCPI